MIVDAVLHRPHPGFGARYSFCQLLGKLADALPQSPSHNCPQAKGAACIQRLENAGVQRPGLFAPSGDS